jgi:site-specific DNA-methyltransferase (adenine-specific)
LLEENKIYNIDFREGLKLIDEEIGLIATDPPYNINFKYDTYSDDLTEDEYIELLCEFQNYPLAIIHYPEETMKYFVPSLGIPDEVIAWCYNSNISRQFRLINFYNCKVDFNKVKQPYKNPNDKRIRKRIENGSKGTRLYDWFNDIQLVKNVSKEKTEHPCQVPVELMERIILLTTNEGDLVVDPFMGSGTTAIACINTNRRFIGFEIDEKYYELAKNRINQHIINNNLQEKYNLIA